MLKIIPYISHPEWFALPLVGELEGVVCTLLLAWLLDLILGDPSWLPHPIVYMGKWIAFGERHLNKDKHRKLKGALFSLTSICGVFILTWGILTLTTVPEAATVPESFAFGFPSILPHAIGALLLFFCLAGHTLRKEVRMVFEALERGLDEGRRQVARIVGRDTANLSEQEVRTAALETLAENLSDGVIAPLFWFLLLGVPGAMAYKMINTLDSMIGYQNERYKDFGCWAAHIDDIANYIPARITAFLILLAAFIHYPFFGCASGASGVPISHFPRNLLRTIKYGPQHASPNSGWPEAALASILDCRFGGPHNYFGKEFYKPYIGENPRPLTFSDMKKSIRICLTAEVIAVLIITTILILCSN